MFLLWVCFMFFISIGRGMITVLILKKACINLFITYFNIELKRTKLTSHTDTKLMDMSDRYRLRVLLPKRQQIFPRWTFSKRQLTVGRKWRHGAQERLDIVLSEFCPDSRYRCGTSGVYVWAKFTLNTYTYVIIYLIFSIFITLSEFVCIFLNKYIIEIYFTIYLRREKHSYKVIFCKQFILISIIPP